ncbi:hypothetical protein EVAR_45849_1 [Eumeta japonica]|uniref:Uncharacterized protein n=1 Tax=Eumeta variegata TaxID=151549 RepID=A0A4C1WMC8_EUMVA|nr:hypothetical protein EVAR_45849_1 [Eumeta japonica]
MRYLLLEGYTCSLSRHKCADAVYLQDARSACRPQLRAIKGSSDASHLLPNGLAWRFIHPLLMVTGASVAIEHVDTALGHISLLNMYVLQKSLSAATYRYRQKQIATSAPLVRRAPPPASTPPARPRPLAAETPVAPTSDSYS